MSRSNYAAPESPRHPGLRTLAIHAGQQPDATSGAIATPVVTSASFAYDVFDTGAERFAGTAPGYLYSRFANPTVAVLEAKMAALEGGDTAIAFASGMAAIASTLLTLLSAGDEVVYVGTLYGGTEGVMRTLLPQLGILSRKVATADELASHLTPQTKVVYVETPSNPLLGITDLQAVAQLARSAGVLTVADNTFATPCLSRPLMLGLDVVVHSATKYIGGHGDATGGVAVTRTALARAIRDVGMKQFGACMSPHEASALIRGLKTLPLRIDACCDSAQQIAHVLESHPAISRVHYPGLTSHAGHAVAARQMQRFGGILSFELRGGRPAARAFLDALALITQAVSVGHVDSLACHPASTTHSAVDASVRQQSGVTEGLVRLSVGIEDTEDLLADVMQALGET
jgi:methionine-gamma-lyase